MTVTPPWPHVPAVRLAWREPAGLRRHGVAEPESFMASAVCREVDPELFFAREKDRREVREAKKVCERCPVRVDCAEYAIRRPELMGIWGGLTDRERWQYRR